MAERKEAFDVWGQELQRLMKLDAATAPAQVGPARRIL